MKILAVSGSLRAQSKNKALLLALALVAPAELEIKLYEELEQVPAFNPDLEGVVEIPSVSRFSGLLKEADAVVFSTPEYAHGVPGALKNALDWVVGSGELSGKPVALVNASARAVYAQTSLRETLRTMDARFLEAAEVTVPLPGKALSPDEIAANAEFAETLRCCLRALAAHLQADY